MRRTSTMKMLCGTLIGIVALLMVVPLAVAGPRSFPSWDKQINKPSRFKVLDEFADAAVLDKETGLVWEQSPETAPNPTTPQAWVAAQTGCNTRTVGGRWGWRLPTIQELASLLDPNNPDGNPDLPPDHPFSNVEAATYWSATTDSSGDTFAWVVDFNAGLASAGAGKANPFHVWCVRGGQGVDPQ